MTTTIIFCYNLICILKQNFISCLRNKLLFPDLARFILLLIAIAGLSGPDLRTHRAERNAAGIPQLPPCTGHDRRRGQGDERPADRSHDCDHERRRHAAGHHLQKGFLPHAGRLRVRPASSATRSIWRSPTSGTNHTGSGSPRPSSGAASRSEWRSMNSRSPKSWSWASGSPWSSRATPWSTMPEHSKRWPTTASRSC